MNILRTDAKSKGNKVLLYKLTRSPETQKMSTLDGQRIDVEHYCFYENLKTDKNGNESMVSILTLMTREGEIFGTNSKTIIEEFESILDIFEEDLEPEGAAIPIKVISGVSKNDRTYFTVAYAD